MSLRCIVVHACTEHDCLCGIWPIHASRTQPNSCFVWFGTEVLFSRNMGSSFLLRGCSAQNSLLSHSCIFLHSFIMSILVSVDLSALFWPDMNRSRNLLLSWRHFSLRKLPIQKSLVFWLPNIRDGFGQLTDCNCLNRNWRRWIFLLDQRKSLNSDTH